MKKGFTLIELLVVVLIIGILSSVALPQYQAAVLKSRYAGLLPIVKSLANAQEIYYLENGEYAESFEDLTISLPSSFTLDNGNTKRLCSAKECYNLSFDRMAGSLKNHSLTYTIFLHNSPTGDRNVCSISQGNSSADAERKVCKSLGGTLLGTYAESGITYENYKLP